MLLPFITAAVTLAAFSSAQASVPICLTSCIGQFCTDITHLNCVCIEHASDIQNCVAVSCNTADQTLSQQNLGQNCLNTTSSASAAAALSTSTLVVVYSQPTSVTSGTQGGAQTGTAFSSESLTAPSAASSMLLSSTTPPTSTTSNSAVPAISTTTASATPTESTSSSAGLSSAAKGGIIGGVIGGVALLGALGFGFFFYRRHVNKNGDELPRYHEVAAGKNAIRYPEPEDLNTTDVGGRLNNEGAGYT